MNNISKNIADRIINYLIAIYNNNLEISEADVLEEEDEGLQEILLGLRHLNEDLIFSKANEAKAIQQIKAKNIQLSKQNDELEHFAYIVSHDLKAPLLALHSLTSFIEDDLKNGKIDDVQTHLDLLKKRIERMNKLIFGILNFSKIGMTKSEKEVLDLNELAKEVFDSLDANKDFEFRILNKLPKIKGIRALFVQLFSNLISNSLKFNDKPKGYISINYKDFEKHHELTFSDNGPGVAKQYLEKIFGILQTLDDSYTLKNTGIGLAIVKKILNSLEGTIRVESELGKGISFIIEIPKYKVALL